MTAKPLLFIDVDGPLNPFAAKPQRRPDGYTTHRMRPSGWDQPWQKPLRVWLNAAHGPRLMALPFELVWATTWGTQANRWIAPQLGLPELPAVDWAELHARRGDGTYFKTHEIVRYAAGRPFAWVDDEIGLRDREYVTVHHDAPSLLLRIDPRLGLLDDDFDLLAEWAHALTSP